MYRSYYYRYIGNVVELAIRSAVSSMNIITIITIIIIILAIIFLFSIYRFILETRTCVFRQIHCDSVYIGEGRYAYGYATWDDDDS